MKVEEVVGLPTTVLKDCVALYLMYMEYESECEHFNGASMFSGYVILKEVALKAN